MQGTAATAAWTAPRGEPRPQKTCRSGGPGSGPVEPIHTHGSQRQNTTDGCFLSTDITPDSIVLVRGEMVGGGDHHHLFQL